MEQRYKNLFFKYSPALAALVLLLMLIGSFKLGQRFERDDFLPYLTAEDLQKIEQRKLDQRQAFEEFLKKSKAEAAGAAK